MVFFRGGGARGSLAVTLLACAAGPPVLVAACNGTGGLAGGGHDGGDGSIGVDANGDGAGDGAQGPDAALDVGSDAPGEPDASDAGRPDAPDAGCEPIDGGITAHPAWVAFDSNGLGFDRDLFVMRSDGCSRRALQTTSANEKQPVFSPDGKSVAFASDAMGTFQIYLLTLRTGALAKVTSVTLGATEPAYTPDGQRIAYVHDLSSGAHEIRIVGTDGSGDALLVAADGRYPTFSPDGMYVYYNTSTEAFRQNVAGGSPEMVLESNPNDLERLAVSPDGKQFAIGAGECEYDATTMMSYEAIFLYPVMMPVPRVCSTAGGGSELAGGNKTAYWRPAWSANGVIASEVGPVLGAHDLVLFQGGARANLTTTADDERNIAWAPSNVDLP
jgi:hypothetical protein